MKSIHIKAPDNRSFDDDNRVTVFLAGSIEMGSAVNWQQTIVDAFPENVVFFNPRRDDWDSTWDHNSDKFNEQVNWELDRLAEADIILLYFDPSTKSPISLLELGLYARSGKLMVCCPDGFWRQGNVRVVCERYNVPYFTDKDSWMKAIKSELAKWTWN
jgi:hypothetical protein